MWDAMVNKWTLRKLGGQDTAVKMIGRDKMQILTNQIPAITFSLLQPIICCVFFPPPTIPGKVYRAVEPNACSATFAVIPVSVVFLAAMLVMEGRTRPGRARCWPVPGPAGTHFAVHNLRPLPGH